MKAFFFSNRSLSYVSRIEEVDVNSEIVVCSYDEEHDRLSNLSDDLIFNIRIEEADENSEAVVCSYDEEHDRLSNLSDDLIFHIRIEEVDENYETVVCSCDEEHDRLSNLSDDLIFHILSFLSTKESYRTCVLSTRWGSICTKIPDLHFELPEIPDQSVYAALLRRTENIRKLSLDSVVACQPQDVHMWVSKALDLMVQELDLELLLHGKTLLPLRLFRCESLVVLKLRGRICLGFSSSFDVYLPSLKILHLRLIVLLTMFDDHVEYDLDKFLSGCPHEDIFQQPINISLLLLKRLTLYLFMPIVASHIGPVQINAPSLEVLSITDYSSSPIIYEVVNLSNLDEATLFIDQLPDFYSLYTLMKGLSNVKSLTLGSKTFHVSFIIFFSFLVISSIFCHPYANLFSFFNLVMQILSMEDKLEKIHLLTFHNLLSLSVEISENISWSMLVCFLHNTPKLKDLAIEVCMMFS